MFGFTWTYDSADRVQTQTYPSGEVLTTSYDMRGRPSRLTSSTHGTLVSSATYTPLDQPLSRTTGNGVVQSWSYPNPDARLMQLTIGSGFNRSYSYDSVGNVTGITDLLNAANTQSYGYDARDRLTSWTLGGTTATYAYNNIGNLTNKAGTAYTYPAAGTPRPHAPTTVGGQAYSYDANGNLLSGGGRTYVWTADNRPVSVTTSSGTESYRYDADGNRVRRSGGGVTRIYLQDSTWEEQTGGGTIRTSYVFNGQVVAQRDSTGGAPVVYLHGDHLGSVGLTSSTGGAMSAVQEFDPWGVVRSGASSTTLRNYTGQYLDGTGLLFYNARYYDPGLARFVSPDPIAPGKINPQNRNRYSYGLNNPLRFIDPSGYCVENFYDDTRDGCAAYITLHGWALQVADWADNELKVMAESIRDLKAAAGWSITDYIDVMTGGGKYGLQLNRVAVYASDSNRPADVQGPGWFNDTIVMNVYDALFTDTIETQRFNLVHEQAHVWDFASGGAMSQGIMNATGSKYGGGFLGFGQTYNPRGNTSSEYSKKDALEDWAETVAAATYPEGSRSVRSGTSDPRMGTLRQNYIKPFLPNAAIFSSSVNQNRAP